MAVVLPLVGRVDEVWLRDRANQGLVARAGPARVLVNAIAPGPIDTPMVDDLSGEWKQASRPSCPVRRFGHASEVAPSAVLLASDPGATSTSARWSAPTAAT